MSIDSSLGNLSGQAFSNIEGSASASLLTSEQAYEVLIK
jgi:hypothetical protein